MSNRGVLIVEDDLDIAENLKALLALEGFQASISKDGKEALDFLHQANPPPGLILLDLMMPVMDGFQFYEAQKANPALANIPVVVMTAGGNAESRVQKLGVQAYFRKPLDVERLLITIESLVAN